MEDITLLTKNNITTELAFNAVSARFGNDKVNIDSVVPTCFWVDTGEKYLTALFSPANGDQNLWEYEEGEIPPIDFIPYVSGIAYHSYKFAAEIVKALLPLMGEGSLCDNCHGEIIPAEAFIAKYGE